MTPPKPNARPKEGFEFANVYCEKEGYPRCYEVHLPNAEPVYFSDSLESAERIANRINLAIQSHLDRREREIYEKGYLDGQSKLAQAIRSEAKRGRK